MKTHTHATGSRQGHHFAALALLFAMAFLLASPAFAIGEGVISEVKALRNGIQEVAMAVNAGNPDLARKEAQEVVVMWESLPVRAKNFIMRQHPETDARIHGLPDEAYEMAAAKQARMAGSGSSSQTAASSCTAPVVARPGTVIYAPAVIYASPSPSPTPAGARSPGPGGRPRGWGSAGGLPPG